MVFSARITLKLLNKWPKWWIEWYLNSQFTIQNLPNIKYIKKKKILMWCAQHNGYWMRITYENVQTEGNSSNAQIESHYSSCVQWIAYRLNMNMMTDDSSQKIHKLFDFSLSISLRFPFRLQFFLLTLQLEYKSEDFCATDKWSNTR